MDALRTRSGAAVRDQEAGRGRGSAWSTVRTRTIDTLQRRPFIFGTLVVFFGLYYYRPEDFIHPLYHVPMAKIVGILAFGALILGIMGGGKVPIPKAVKILWLLLLQMSLCIPFALWPGGAFHIVFDKFSKGVIVAMLISMTIVTAAELRKLVWIQLSAVGFVTFLSIALWHYENGRLSGVQESILGNPNDLAINIAITFPLCLAFMLQARGLIKAIWGVTLAVMALGVVLTSSRSGLLALMLTIAICVWGYGIKGKRRSLVVFTILASVLGLGIALSSAHYRARVESILLGNIEGSGDRGSREARIELLKKSVYVAVTHPLFGVGPGCFPLVDAGWVVVHNAYTELAAEAGIPALALFLAAIWASLKNLDLVRKSQQYRDDPELRLITQALWAGIAAYLVGSMFASTEYNMYPYFIIGYTSALVRIVTVPSVEQDRAGKHSSLKKISYASSRKPRMIWTQ